MAVATTLPPVLCLPFPDGRTVFSLSSVNRFKPLNCKIHGFGDIDEHYYSRKSLKYWDMFYKRHQNKFFKDRHYLEKDWGKYFSDSDDAVSADGKVLLEVGFGAGNTIFPLMAAYPMLFVHACDFSTEALNLVKYHSNFDGKRMNVFVCDVTNEELCNKILPSSVDLVTLIFMLSAVSPNKMPFVLQNLNKILKPNGHVLVRDYAVGDSAQCSFYFSEDFLSNLFAEAGFCTVDLDTYCRQIENHSRNLTFDRRWVRAIFKKIDS
ncbi:S-adenosyl-L-methionine-dependent methyltransferases superfamily protein [Perilla frutescens var. hirtella]|uniref:tRNA N(3)-methylcytidine methyltransferase n=1 Tax=Perilla frutescens var. hirtella TaxID=608512 RepID=A0AAD4P5K4_PERFH|nr:S-adenosyl-L-methionine-dependent methyltransferases superfamily protein [Perilla frutescens var. hirtella]